MLGAITTMTKKVKVISSISVAILIAIYFSLGTRTMHCPPSHFLGDLVKCEEMFSNEKFTLIQHLELDNNRYYFQVIDKSKEKTHFFEFPEDILMLGKEGYQITVEENVNIRYKVLYEEREWNDLIKVKVATHKF
jgi:hypothetical protein